MATKIEQPRIDRAARLLAIADQLCADQEAAIRERGDVPADPNYGLTENEIAAAEIMNGLLQEREELAKALTDLLAQSDPYRPGRGTEAELNARAQAVAALAKAQDSA